jgi:hypothetical protein
VRLKTCREHERGQQGQRLADQITWAPVHTRSTGG